MKEFAQSRAKLIYEIQKHVGQFDENKLFFFTIPKPISILPDDAEIEIRRKDSNMPIAEDKSLIFKHIGDHALYDARIYTDVSIRKVTDDAYQRIIQTKK